MTHYTLELLKDTADGEALLKLAGKEQQQLKKQRLNLELQKDDYMDTYKKLTADLDLQQISLTIDNEVIERLPEGNYKDEKIDHQAHLVYKIHELKKRLSHHTPQKLLQIELMLERVHKDMEITSAFIAVIETHMKSLQKALPPGEAANGEERL